MTRVVPAPSAVGGVGDHRESRLAIIESRVAGSGSWGCEPIGVSSVRVQGVAGSASAWCWRELPARAFDVEDDGVVHKPVQDRRRRRRRHRRRCPSRAGRGWWRRWCIESCGSRHACHRVVHRACLSWQELALHGACDDDLVLRGSVAASRAVILHSQRRSRRFESAHLHAPSAQVTRDARLCHRGRHLISCHRRATSEPCEQQPGRSRRALMLRRLCRMADLARLSLCHADT